MVAMNLSIIRRWTNYERKIDRFWKLLMVAFRIYQFFVQIRSDNNDIFNKNISWCQKLSESINFSFKFVQTTMIDTTKTLMVANSESINFSFRRNSFRFWQCVYTTKTDVRIYQFFVQIRSDDNDIQQKPMSDVWFKFVQTTMICNKNRCQNLSIFRSNSFRRQWYTTKTDVRIYQFFVQIRSEGYFFDM